MARRLRLRHRVARAAQRGQAFILILLLIGMAVSMLVYGMLGSTSLALQRDKNTEAALAQVKEALIGWSAQRTSSGALPDARPGELPCPDINNDGFEDGSCAAGAVGRVPWKTLGIPEPKDDSGETLWYAIAGPFRIWNMSSVPINSDTKGNITVYSGSAATVMTSEAVAVIFAPGAAFGAQDRSCTVGVNCTATGQCTTSPASLTPKCNPTNYLDSTGGANNATINGPFIAAQKSASFNDRLLLITTSDLIPLVEQRVAREVRTILQTYKTATACATNCSASGGCYPWADLSAGDSDIGLNRGRIPALVASPYDWGVTNACSPAGPPVPRLPGWVSLIPDEPGWFVNNNWRQVVYYSAGKNFLEGGGVTPACTSCVDPTLSVDGVSGKEVVILTPGPAGAGRPVLPYPWYDWTPYLDDLENNNNNNDLYLTPSSTAPTRDRIYTIP